MENFYIFLDIDGVLYDQKWLINEIDKGSIKKGGIIKNFKPSSMEALNYLISELNKNFNSVLVVSSTWRKELEEIKSVLQENGLEYDGEISCTPFHSNPRYRGLEILQYLDAHNRERKNFVIIDDENFGFELFFNKDVIIKAEWGENSLNKEMVNKFLGSAKNRNQCDNYFFDF